MSALCQQLHRERRKELERLKAENTRLRDGLRAIEAFTLGIVQTQYTMDKAHRNLVRQIADRCRAELEFES